MSVVYEVQGDPNAGVVSVLKKYADIKDADGNVVGEETYSALHFPGNQIPEEELASHIKRKYSEGDEYTLSLFTRIELEDEVKVAKPAPKAKEPASAKK